MAVFLHNIYFIAQNGFFGSSLFTLENFNQLDDAFLIEL